MGLQERLERDERERALPVVRGNEHTTEELREIARQTPARWIQCPACDGERRECETCAGESVLSAWALFPEDHVG